MNTFLLSIVIPSYNCEAWLARAVESAFILGREAVEVIVVDDGSTDHTQVLCNDLQARNPTLRVIWRANGGLSAARNTGIDAATGEFIFLLDADDEVSAFDLDVLRNFDGDMLRVGVEEVLIDGSHTLRIQEIASLTGSDYLQLGLQLGHHDLYIPSWAYIYRRSFIAANQLRFGEGLIHEDMLFTIQALLAAKKVVATKALAYRYIRREGSITHQGAYPSRRRRVHSLARIARELTPLVNAHAEIDLWRWTSTVIDYGWSSGQVGDSRRLAFTLLVAECRLFLHYKLWGRYRTRGDVRWRLRVALTRFLCLRDPRSGNSNGSDSGSSMRRFSG